MAQRIKTVQESDLRMLGDLARSIQRVLPVTQADIDAAAALGKGWVVTRVFEVSDPLDNLRGGTQLVIRQNSILPGQSVQRVLIVSGPGGQTVVVRGTDYIALPDAIANSLSYVKAFGGTEQRNIPQPYTQVNYVTNTAQTAVNTGVMIDFAKNYEFEVECRAVGSSWYILQSRASSSGNITGIHGATSGSTITLVVGNVTVCTSAITRTVGNKLYVKATLNAGTATLYVKDETANTEDTQTGSYGTSQPNPTAAVYLLGNAGGQYADINSDIYMARIKENGVTVMDYVPARQVATAGFYDTVSETFKTAETPANLSADGNTVPTPDTPVDIVSNNGVLKARHQSGLPLGYKLVDYIKSNAMIELDKPTNDTMEFVAKLYREGTNAQYAYQSDTSSSGTTNTTAYISSGGNWRFGRRTASIDLGTGVMITSVQNAIGVWLNGEQVGTYEDVTAFTSTNNLRLFGTQSTPQLRLYGLKVYQNGAPFYDLVPCQRESDSAYGVYDLVSGQFFTNTDATITAGSFVSDPVEIYTDGTVETIKDSLNNTATAEMLLKVGNYQDEQEILSGAITRNVGVKVLDGTEEWTYTSSRFRLEISDYLVGSSIMATIISHYKLPAIASGSIAVGEARFSKASATDTVSDKNTLLIHDNNHTSLNSYKTWLADQYNAGTPVIVVYPLATPTTESVTGQHLQVTDGDNVLEITQASLNGLELEAEYQAAVSLTIQEVQDANLDNNVEVTIS